MQKKLILSSFAARFVRTLGAKATVVGKKVGNEWLRNWNFVRVK